jgi:hypothetical protein
MIRVGLTALALTAAAAGAEPLQPAELPSADYAGLQYVDSRGCTFARAGNGVEVVWIPRVSRQGIPECGNPPSGQRVPVAQDVSVQPEPAAAASGAEAEASGGYFVAVGSFGQPGNADRAAARLAELDYGVVRGRVQSGGGTLTTIFAGPFADRDSATAARQKLEDTGFPDAMLIQP